MCVVPTKKSHTPYQLVEMLKTGLHRLFPHVIMDIIGLKSSTLPRVFPLLSFHFLFLFLHGLGTLVICF